MFEKGNRMPKISIIMPVYNAEKFLEETMNSIKKQKLNDYELICINDHSTDCTMNILQTFSAYDNRIKLLENNGEKGAATARNLGIKYASGKYLCFLDGDDIFDEDMLIAAYEAAERNSASIVIFNYQHVLSKEIYIKRTVNFSQAYRKKYCEHTFDVKKQDSFDWVRWSGSPCNKIFKREFIISHNIEFQNLPCCNDVYFVFMAIFLSNKTLVLNDERVMLYARDHNTASRISINRNPMCMYYAINKIERTFLDENLMEHYSSHFFYFAFYVLKGTIEKDKNEQQRREFYNFLQSKGIEQLMEQGQSFYQKVPEKLQNYYNNFLIEDFSTYWFEKINLIDEYLEKYGEDIVSLVQKFKEKNKKVALWGAGKNGYSILRFCRKMQIYFDEIIDNDPKKWGMSIWGYKIKPFQKISSDIEVIFISAQNILEDVKKQIAKQGIEVLDLNFIMDIDYRVEGEND